MSSIAQFTLSSLVANFKSQAAALFRDKKTELCSVTIFSNMATFSVTGFILPAVFSLFGSGEGKRIIQFDTIEKPRNIP